MFELIVGGLAAAVLMQVGRYADRKGRPLAWWGWLAVLFGVGLGVLTLEAAAAMVREGMLRGAAVMAALLGFLTAIWWVLSFRLVLQPLAGSGAEIEGEGGRP